MMEKLRQMLIHTNHLRQTAHGLNRQQREKVDKYLEPLDELLVTWLKEVECQMLQRLAEEAE